jgi:hypothetical protein
MNLRKELVMIGPDYYPVDGFPDSTKILVENSINGYHNETTAAFL